MGQSRILRAGLIILPAALLGSAGRVEAQGADDPVATCQAAASAEPAAATTACSALLAQERPELARSLVLNLRGVARFRQGEFGEAEADFRAALAQDRSLVEAMINQGLARSKQGDLDGALAEFDRALKLIPGSASALANRGDAWLARREFAKAEQDFEQALAVDKDSVQALNGRGIARWALGQLDRALADFDRVIELRPGGAAGYQNRAGVLVQQGEVRRAVADYDRAIELPGRDHRSFTARGEALRLAGELDKALESHDEAVRLDASDAEALYHRALVWQDKGSLDKAEADLSRALLIDPRNGRALADRGRIRTTLAAIEKAEQDEKAKASEAEALAPVNANERRVALVVGNSAYRNAAPLTNPANDATDMARALRELGFDVVEGRDLDWRGMVETVREFSRRLEKADLALLYYAGHGVQVSGRNYLVPIDGKLERSGDLDVEAMDLQTILRPMQFRDRVSLIFLDACRDNPFTRSLARSMGTRSTDVGRGLAPISSNVGSLVAFATEPDGVALDGKLRNSPFTAALLKHIRTPGLEVELMLKRVRADVRAATKGRQFPRVDSGLIGNVVLGTTPPSRGRGETKVARPKR